MGSVNDAAPSRVAIDTDVETMWWAVRNGSPKLITSPSASAVAVVKPSPAVAVSRAVLN